MSRRRNHVNSLVSKPNFLMDSRSRMIHTSQESRRRRIQDRDNKTLSLNKTHQDFYYFNRDQLCNKY